MAELKEELMSTRLREVGGFAELKEFRLRDVEIEAQTKLKEQQDQLEESQWRFSDLEGKLTDQTVRGRIREVEKAQSIAELKQNIDNLEFQNQQQQLVKSLEENNQIVNVEDTIPSLRHQIRFYAFEIF
eukprot:GFUD01008559.1.p1 GENE.GFUD01008559.1~~GFUD01008559.1.p1  ORF type:complete len:129 (-),score=57.60 GFUD01008559.1:469-855(-)